MQNKIIFPIEPLLRNPNMFYLVTEQLGGIIPPEDLYEFFFELLTASMEPENIEGDIEEHVPTKVMFESNDDGGGEFSIIITLNNGACLSVSGHSGPETISFSSEKELQHASFIYHKIVSNLEEEWPERKGDIFLVDTPSPDNNFLQTQDGKIEGYIGFHSEPNKTMKFRISSNEGDEIDVSFSPD